MSRFFSASVIHELATRGRSPLFTRLFRESGLIDLFEGRDFAYNIFEKAFSFLKQKDNRHEYVYKAILTHKILLGRHSLNTASMLTEFRVGECKADYVIFNGTSTAYEIKSERDSLTRLEKQIKDYMKVFANVNVIAGENHIKAIEGLVHEDVGILKLSNRHDLSISPIRAPKESPERTSPVAIFESIQIKEAKMILKSLNIDIPDVPNTMMYKELKDRFSRLDPVEVHHGMVNTLKKTRDLMPLKNLVDNLPDSLKPVVLSTSIRKRDHSRFLKSINTQIQDLLDWA